MALVAFPFASCITSEDVDEDNMYDSFGSSQSASDGEAAVSDDVMEEHDNSDDHLSNDTVSSEVTPSSMASVPSIQPEDVEEEANDNTHQIDELFFEHLNEDEPENDEDAMEVEQTRDSTTFAGLNNLGNTCYLNSAVQMLNSLDHFTKELKRTPLPEFDAGDDTSQKSLRDALLEVSEALNRGETVRPDAFKRVIDDRTPLFVGFRQQDAHELLSTLLDLLDEDYKRKPEKPDTGDKDEKPQTMADQTKTEDASDENMAVLNIKGEEGPLDSGSLACYESVAKKPRNHLDLSKEPSAPVGSRCQSFSELKPEGIEELLHGASSTAKLTETCTTPTSPRYKLVGGRMTAPESGHSLCIDESDVSTTLVSKACEDMEETPSACSETSPIDSNFRTEVRKTITCDSCRWSRTKIESYLHLSLEIGSENSCVADGLRKFFSSEIIELKCEKCFCETAQQTFEITRLPRALLLHFKRFIVDVSPDYSSISYRKNQSDVSFDEKLLLEEEKGGILGEFLAKDVSIPDRPESCVTASEEDQDRCYHIRSVVNHMGSSANCGHYTADSWRLYPDGNRVWTRFNDSYVSQISAEEAIRESSRTAYMVMYEISP